MKTVIIIVVIVGLILVFNFLTLSFFEKETEYYEKEISEIILKEEEEKYTKADKQLEEMHTHWQEKETMWNMLCDHSEVEEISLLMCTAKSEFVQEEYTSSITSLKNLSKVIEFAGKRYSILIDNIS